MKRVLYVAVYVEIDLFCIAILSYLLFRMKQNQDERTINLSFYRVVVSLIVMLVVDCVQMSIEGRQGAALVTCNAIANTLYMGCTGTVSYIWLCHVQKFLGIDRRISTWHKILQAVPLALLWIVAAATPFTGWLFRISPENVYARGSLYFLQPILGFLPMVQALYLTLRSLRSPLYKKERLEILSLLSFFVAPALGGILETAVYGLPTLWPMATFSVLTVFVNLQSYQISTDSLTSLNNRRRFDQQIADLVRDWRPEQPLQLMIMDVDWFKSINDTYGHYEGDQALIAVAQILKVSCGNSKAFLARYGGDEFAILVQGSKEEALALARRIRNGFDLWNKASGKPYTLGISIGCSEYGSSSDTSVGAFIACADRVLYEQKRARN